MTTRHEEEAIQRVAVGKCKLYKLTGQVLCPGMAGPIAFDFGAGYNVLYVYVGSANKGYIEQYQLHHSLRLVHVSTYSNPEGSPRWS